MLSWRLFIVAFGLCFAVGVAESSESESNESVENPGFLGRLAQGAGINWIKEALQGSVSKNVSCAWHMLSPVKEGLCDIGTGLLGIQQVGCLRRSLGRAPNDNWHLAQS